MVPRSFCLRLRQSHSIDLSQWIDRWESTSSEVFSRLQSVVDLRSDRKLRSKFLFRWANRPAVFHKPSEVCQGNPPGRHVGRVLLIRQQLLLRSRLASHQWITHWKRHVRSRTCRTSYGDQQWKPIDFRGAWSSSPRHIRSPLFILDLDPTVCSTASSHHASVCSVRRYWLVPSSTRTYEQCTTCGIFEWPGCEERHGTYCSAQQLDSRSGDIQASNRNASLRQRHSQEFAWIFRIQFRRTIDAYVCR